MCEYCKKSKKWAVPLEKGDISNCYWDRVGENDPAGENSEECLKPATQLVYHQFVAAHLCQDHMLKSVGGLRKMLVDLIGPKYIRIFEEECQCLGWLNGPPLPTDETKIDDFFNSVILCGLPATYAQIGTTQTHLCDEHANKYLTQEEWESPYIGGQFAWKKTSFPINEIGVYLRCLRKGCGKVILGDESNLPEVWQTILMSRKSLQKPISLMCADVDGYLCPEHYQEINNMLLISPIRFK
jgi:hypothetical protein